MNSVIKQAKDIVQCLEGVVQAFESSVIGSDDYRDKAMLMHQNVSALAHLHPNWCEERKMILNVHQHNAPPLDDSDPFILIYEYSEVLFKSWHRMRVSQPSLKTLSYGGVMLRAALASLHEECDDLTNRKSRKHPASVENPAEQTNPPVTVVTKACENSTDFTQRPRKCQNKKGGNP